MYSFYLNFYKQVNKLVEVLTLLLEPSAKFSSCQRNRGKKRGNIRKNRFNDLNITG